LPFDELSGLAADFPEGVPPDGDEGLLFGMSVLCFHVIRL